MNSNFILEVAKAATTGKIDSETAHHIFQINAGRAGLVKEKETLPVLDCNGNPLIAGKKYQHRRGPYGEYFPALIESATFGSGNILDTYYRVHYITTDLEKSFTVVEGEGDPFKGYIYQGDFCPMDEE